MMPTQSSLATPVVVVIITTYGAGSDDSSVGTSDGSRFSVIVKIRKGKSTTKMNAEKMLNHLPLYSAAYMRQGTEPALVKVIACRLFGAKPLPEPMLAYCQLESWEQISVKFESEFYHFHLRKCIWKCRLPERRPFCPGGWVKKHTLNNR